MLNDVKLQGRWVMEPECKTTPKGMLIANARIAVDKGRKDREGNTADYFDVVLFGTKAEAVRDYTTKGTMLIIEGRLQSRTWKDADGRSRYSVEVLAEDVHLLESKEQTERRRAGKEKDEATKEAGAGKKRGGDGAAAGGGDQFDDEFGDGDEPDPFGDD